MGSPFAVSGFVPSTLESCTFELAELPPEVLERSRFGFTSVYVNPRTLGKITFGPERVVTILRRDQTLLLRGLLEATTNEEFLTRRRNISRAYWLLSESIRTAVSARFSTSDWAQLARSSVRSLLAEIDQKGPARIGVDAVEEAVFSVSTLGRIPRLLAKLIECTREAEASDHLSKLFGAFKAHTLICELHLHLLILMLSDEAVHIRQFALAHALHGIRSSLTMYGSVREAASLLQPPEPMVGEPLTLDDEDRDLLEASAKDAENTLRLN